MIWSVTARSEEHTSELQSRTLTSYAVFCLKKKKRTPELNWLACGAIFHASTTPGVTRVFFFFNDTDTNEIYTSVHTLSLHDALPIYVEDVERPDHRARNRDPLTVRD